MKKSNPPTYAGIPEEFGRLESSPIVLLPVPYDGTSTWGKGADKGPAAFLDASENMELYDIETDTEVYRRGIYLSEPLDGHTNAAHMVEEIEAEVEKMLGKGKFVTLFGGEHSISIGAMRAFRKRFEEVTVLQIDAHADLRKSYDGTPFNHACAVYEANREGKLVQVGIRSMDISEREEMHPENVFFAHQLDLEGKWMHQVIDRLGEKVYITLDLDAFDPSILPATGTPEPGGLRWYPTLKFLRRVFEEREVVGFDIVELCPGPNDRASAFLAAKLYYKMLTYKFCLPGKSDRPNS